MVKQRTVTLIFRNRITGHFQLIDLTIGRRKQYIQNIIYTKTDLSKSIFGYMSCVLR